MRTLKDMCLADRAAYGQCILDKGHEGSIHQDAHGHKFCTDCTQDFLCYNCASAKEVNQHFS